MRIRGLLCRDCAALFQKEETDLIGDLHSLPKSAAVRKINELVKRAKLAKVPAWAPPFLNPFHPTTLELASLAAAHWLKRNRFD